MGKNVYSQSRAGLNSVLKLVRMHCTTNQPTQLAYHMKRIVPISLLATLLLHGCTTTHAPPEFAQLKEDPLARSVQQLQTPPSDTTPEAAEPQPHIYLGSDQVVAMPEPRGPIRLHGDAVSLNFEQTPLREVVHAILGDLLELDYIIEQPISGEITLATRRRVEREQLLVILESLLYSNGYVIHRDEQDRLLITTADNLNQLAPAFASPHEQGAGYRNVIIPLNYIRATEMADILRPVARESSFVRVDNKRNLLILAGTRNQISGWLEIINTFDIDLLEGMSVGIFPLHNSRVGEVAKALDSLLATAPASAESGDAGTSSANISAMVQVFPLESLNSIIVVTPRAHYLKQLRTWITRLDAIQEQGDEMQLYVYAVQNSNAAHLAGLLNSIFGSDGPTRPEGSDVAPDATPARTVTREANPARSEQTTRSRDSFTLEGGVRVVADDQNNALLIYAKQREYRKIATALRQLDLAPTQVMIEASILEVSLTDELQYGLDWALKNNKLGGGYTGSASLTLSDGGMAVQTPGFGYAISDAAGALRGVLNALAEESLVNVISSPSIMVLDNHTASIHVGDQQPVRSAQSVTDGGVTTTSINYRDTGVLLSVTPSVNAGGMISMTVKQSVTDVGPVDTATNQRSFLERNIDSRIAVRSGESIVLGGLIRDNRSRGRSGIPLLHRIPLLGGLFSSQTQSANRTELLVIITPRALFNDQDLRQISQEMRGKMHGLRQGAEQLPQQQ